MAFLKENLWFNRAMLSIIIFLICSLLAGCAAGFEPQAMDTAADFRVQTVVKSSSVGAMAVSAEGQMVAWGDRDLNLKNLATGQRSHLLDQPPETLCWSPDGLMLAATVLMDGESHLYVFGADGVLVYKHHFPGHTTRLQWPRYGRLTASVLTTQTYSFGTHISGQLLQWDGRWRILTIPLYETTIVPSIAKILQGRLSHSFDFDLSPLEDEVLYTRIYAPPAFDASRRLMLHNLQTGQEKQVAVFPLLGGAGRLAEGGESAVINGNFGQLKLQNLWTNKILAQWSGDRFDYDAASDLLVTETGLFHAEHLLVALPA
ncbi:MAG: hypothetical protein L3J63_11110, partial [Geopsychrobacter sp.]|nr:hypothetical protein [Geopsychrobacter sp.]